MIWKVEYLKEALKDLKSLDHSQRIQVLKAIDKVSQNPLPIFEGGYGKPLGNKANRNLTGYYKIKLLKLGIRVVYGLIREKGVMKIIVISIRDDEVVYETAVDRIDSNRK
jgi:mRNA interferase RelE/StbE